MKSTTEKSKKTRGLEPKATQSSEAKTEKIRVAVNHQEVKELDITFPYFVNDREYYCKFIRRDKAITVIDYSFSKAINYGLVPEDWLVFSPITEEEFNAKFNEVMTVLIDINNEKII